MTLIEDREAFEPPVLGKRAQQELESNHPFDESGSDDEYSIANEGYSENGENNNNRDFFSLPTLGLNYLNNLNLSLNLNLNLRNTSLWRIYENSPFPKSGFLSHYLRKHGEEGLDIDGHDIHSDSRSYSTLANFLRQAFQAYEEDYSEEAILERVRFKELQRQAEAGNKLGRESNFISDFQLSEKERQPRLFSRTESYFDKRFDLHDSSDCKEEEEEEEEKQEKQKDICTEEAREEKYQEDMPVNSGPAAIHPFYNRQEVTIWDWIKILLLCWLGVVRSILVLPILFFAFLFSSIGLFGVTLEESQLAPLSRWRRAFRWVTSNILMRMFCFIVGFVWRVKGKAALPTEAPIFVVAPHSSFFDCVAVILLGAPSVVAKLATKDLYIFGKLVTFTQPVYVNRENKGSRKATVEALKTRAQGILHGSGMPQIFIFPEGTCSNRSSLVRFKPGAFAPQVPIQPVVIRYPNEFDTHTWTFDGISVPRNLFYCFSKLYNWIEIEYLPVYTPSEAEKQDSKLFAENVRQVMAKALDIPTSEYQYEDGNLLFKMRESNLVKRLKGIYRAKKALGLTGSTQESATILGNKLTKTDYYWQFPKFQNEFFGVPEGKIIPEVRDAFNNFKKKDDDEIIDIRPYLLFTCILYEDPSFKLDALPQRIYKLYELNNPGDEDLNQLMKQIFEVSMEDAPMQAVSAAPSQVQVNPEVPKTSDLMKQRVARYCEHAKLFADEVTERLSKTYPRPEDKDKLPNTKQKSD